MPGVWPLSLSIRETYFHRIRGERGNGWQRGLLFATERTGGGRGLLIQRCIFKAPHTKRKLCVRDVLRRHSWDRLCTHESQKDKGAKGTLHWKMFFPGNVAAPVMGLRKCYPSKTFSHWRLEPAGTQVHQPYSCPAKIGWAACQYIQHFVIVRYYFLQSSCFRTTQSSFKKNQMHRDT